jgi:hypothetical protein
VGSLYVIGDVHGQLKTLHKLLQHEKLIDAKDRWAGGEVRVWFLGDLVDRGPDGLAVMDLVMRLQHEAEIDGGQIACLLGNHELMLLAAYRFGRRSTGLGSSFITRWKRNGGKRKDLMGLTKQHLDWLASLPMLGKVGDYLLIHADAPLYLKYGHSVEEVNKAFKTLLQHSDSLAWEELIDEFAMRGLFYHQFAGDEFVQRFLSTFDCRCIIHGHTPISVMMGYHAKKVTSPMVYADEHCINVDGGMFLGGPGFVYRIEI